MFLSHIIKVVYPGVNFKKKLRCTSVLYKSDPMFSQVHTNLNSLKVFTSSSSRPPSCIYNGIWWVQLFFSSWNLRTPPIIAKSMLVVANYWIDPWTPHCTLTQSGCCILPKRSVHELCMHFDLSELYTDPICSKTLFHTAHVGLWGWWGNHCWHPQILQARRRRVGYQCYYILWPCWFGGKPMILCMEIM